MRESCIISLNQLADFKKSTPAKKRSIIKQQKQPNSFKMAWYQLSKARFRKSIELNGDLEPVLKGIEELRLRIPEKTRQIRDKVVSLEAMQRFLNIKLPDLIKAPLEKIKGVNSKSIIVNGVEVVISPDVIFKIHVGGKFYLGAVKIHVSKNNIFDNEQSRLISSLLYKYLEEVVQDEKCEILPELCLSIDVFGERVVSVPNNYEKSIRDIEEVCEEVKTFWKVA